MASTAVKDTSNNAYAGISDTTTLSFTAADIAAPTLASSSPADDATGVAVNSNIVLTFDETVQAGTGNITLFKSDNTQVEVFDVTTDVTVSGATVTLDPASDAGLLARLLCSGGFDSCPGYQQQRICWH